MAAQHPAAASWTREDRQHAEIDAEAGPSSTGTPAPQPSPAPSKPFGRQTALLLLAHGRDGLVFIVTAAARLLWRSLGGTAAVLLQNKQWLVRAPLEALRLLRRLVSLVLQSRAMKALVAVAARIASLQLSVGGGGQEEREDGHVRANVRLSSYLSLLFGTLRLRTHTSLQLATPSLHAPLVPNCSAASPTHPAGHLGRSYTDLSPASTSVGGQQEVHLLCSSELKRHILAFLSEQSQRDGQGYVLLRASTSGKPQESTESDQSTSTHTAPSWHTTSSSSYLGPSRSLQQQQQQQQQHAAAASAAVPEPLTGSLSDTWAVVSSAMQEPIDATAAVSSSRPGKCHSTGHSGVRSSCEHFEALAASSNAAPSMTSTSVPAGNHAANGMATSSNAGSSLAAGHPAAYGSAASNAAASSIPANSAPHDSNASNVTVAGSTAAPVEGLPSTTSYNSSSRAASQPLQPPAPPPLLPASTADGSSCLNPDQRSMSAPSSSLPSTPKTPASDDDSIIAAPLPMMMHEKGASPFMPPPAVYGRGRASPIAFPARHGVHPSRKAAKAPLPPPPFAPPPLATSNTTNSTSSGSSRGAKAPPPGLALKDAASLQHPVNGMDGSVLASPGSGGLKGLLGGEGEGGVLRRSMEGCWVHTSPSKQPR